MWREAMTLNVLYARYHVTVLQSGLSGCHSWNREILSNSQVCCLAQLCMATALFFFLFPVRHPLHPLCTSTRFTPTESWINPISVESSLGIERLGSGRPCNRNKTTTLRMTRRARAPSCCGAATASNRFFPIPKRQPRQDRETMLWKIGHHMHQTCGMLAR